MNYHRHILLPPQQEMTTNYQYAQSLNTLHTTNIYNISRLISPTLIYFRPSISASVASLSQSADPSHLQHTPYPTVFICFARQLRAVH